MMFSNFWQLLAGLGMFLFGMFQLEDSLKQLAGRTFKLFLRKHTHTRIGAIFSGTVVTAVLQSSSVVSLMVLTFVGAGIISMRNALGVVFGANLGTTLDNWIVASLGFKLDIEKFALPIIALAGIGLIAFRRKKNLFQISKFGMGFGLMFLGLSFMKESFEMLVKDFDFTPYIHLNKFVFVIIGFVITALIQASSATMVITLSALNAGIFPFEIAVAVIIGSELGTSIKIVLGAIGGIAAKKRVALGNIIFNAVTVLAAYAFMTPIIRFIQYVLGAHEPMIGLVMFQTIINLGGVILFFPVLKFFGDFLEKCFIASGKSATQYLQLSSPLLPELAMDMMEKETLYFIHRVIELNKAAFNIRNGTETVDKLLLDSIEKNEAQFQTYSEKYDNVKQAEGEILQFYTKINEKKISNEYFERINQLLAAVRNAMYSAKGIKDIRQDRKDLRDSANDVKYEQYKLLQVQLEEFYNHLKEVLHLKDKVLCLDELLKLMKKIGTDYNIRRNNIYIQLDEASLEKVDISTLLNVNREVYSSCKAMIFSLKNFLLDEKSAKEFDNSPMDVIK